MKNKKLLSIIIPAHNEKSNIEPLINKIFQVTNEIKFTTEILIIDDGSSDETYAKIKELREKFENVKGVKLSNNFGQQNAIDCGLKLCLGDIAITMDADMQHNPDIIIELIKKWEEGYLIVNTRKINYNARGLVKKNLSSCFYKFFNYTSRIKLSPSVSDFRLLDRKCIDALNSINEQDKFFKGLVSLIGFKSCLIDIDIDKRNSGDPSFNFYKSLTLAISALFSFSSFALWIPIILGLFTLAVCTLYFFASFLAYLYGYTNFVKGWLSIFMVILMMFSIQFIFIGIFAIYISKIFYETKKRPHYFIEDKTF